MFLVSKLSTIFTFISFIYYYLVWIWIVDGETPISFYPKESITINCGSYGNSTDLDGRQWIGDAHTKFFVVDRQNAKTKSLKAVERDHHTNSIPYSTARLSHSLFTYTFNVISGPTFIRLHFYPASYGGFTRSNAFFTVKAGPYTLLSNFSTSLSADAFRLKTIVKEFSLHVEENKPLKITFSPFRSSYRDEVYAFVNGIEVVSMPTTLYYNSLRGDSGTSVVGHDCRVQIGNNIALETVHRLNIGGITILSALDTGMFREWSSDSNYLVEPGSNVSPLTTSMKINYGNMPSYVAPQKVYQTSWEMELSKKTNSGLGFSWKLPVDLGFRYLVRFHLCELDYHIKKMGHRVFSIFINNQMVEGDGDLIKWAGCCAIAMHVDYIVMMEGDRMEGKSDLIIAFYSNLTHEFQLEDEPMDSILKGLEVFKLSNHDKNLAGVNPTVPLMKIQATKRSSFALDLHGLNSIFTIVVLLLTIPNIIIYNLRISRIEVQDKVVFSYPPEEQCCRFSLAELKSATNNFDDELVIGRGGFGKVYKGNIKGVTKTVAIKRLSVDSKQGAEEFWTEIGILSKFKHDHILDLIGYCVERKEMIIVYEYLPRGTLADHLYKNNYGKGKLEPMTWERRLQICIDAARGLNFLHNGSETNIIHRDVKSANILLDENWVAKISDFGLCKKIRLSHSFTHVSTIVKGTFGYLDPEYFLNGTLTLKTDVYAFGVVLLEVLCGRPAVDASAEDDQRSLALWAQSCFTYEMVDQMIDPSLSGQIPITSLKLFSTIAKDCLHNHLKKRPSMADVVSRLQSAFDSLNGEKDSSIEKMNYLDKLKLQLQEFEQPGNKENDPPIVPINVLHKPEDLSGGNSQTVTNDIGSSQEFEQPGDKENDPPIVRINVLHRKQEDLSGWNLQSAFDSLNGESDSSIEKMNYFDMLKLQLQEFEQPRNKENDPPIVPINVLHKPEDLSGGNPQTVTDDIGSSHGLGQVSGTNGNSDLSPITSGYMKGRPKVYSLNDLKRATQNFMQYNLLGIGAFGSVFKGWIDEKTLEPCEPDEGIPVAIKTLDRHGAQGLEEWQAEVNFLGSLSHPNLIKLIGYCLEEGNLLLVYEFAENGSLENVLYGKNPSNVPFSWEMRIKIAIEVAHALAFLHTPSVSVIVRDIKPSNILLDKNYNAKLTDFGLAKKGPDIESSHVSTRVMGTAAYAAPEYVSTGHLYHKSDVYSFGVILLEMLSGLRAVDPNRSSEMRSLVEWAKPYLAKKRKIKLIMDSRMERQYSSKAAIQVLNITLQCLDPDPKKRPSMKEVAASLERVAAAKKRTSELSSSPNNVNPVSSLHGERRPESVITSFFRSIFTTNFK